MSSTQNQPEVIVELSDPVNPVEIPDAPPTCSVNGLAKIGKKKRTSSAWVMYDFVDIPDPENQGAMKSVAKCKICGELKDPKSTSGTSHFFRHTKACSKKNRVDLTQTTISQAASGNLATFKYSQVRARKNVIKLIILRELPFQFVEDPFFQHFINESFHPAFTKFSRGTVRNDILKCFREEKHALKTVLLSCPGKISFTSDIWQSNQCLSYISLTAHYIDSDWNLHKRILSYSLLDKSHTGEHIAQMLNEKICNEWELSEKVFCLSLDNASANTVSVGKLKTLIPNLSLNGELFHVRCCCHILNLVVQDGLKVPQFREMIQHIKGNLEYIFVSGTRYVQFRNLCESNGVSPKKLQLDVKHRWNSTYLMLRDALPYRNVVTLFLSDRACPYNISENDWMFAGLLCDFLKPFYDATVFFSGVDYVTVNHVMEYLVEIGSVFKLYRHESMFSEIISVMEMKFVKYWGDTPLLFGIACLLDPRIKSKLDLVLVELEHCFLTSAQTINCSASQSISVSRKMEDLFNEYSSCITARRSVNSNVPDNSNLVFTLGSGSSVGSCSSRSSFWQSLGRAPREPGAALLGELTRYQSEPDLSVEEFENFQVLKWWKENEKRFPVMSMIARDVLAVPVSTVASESAFSLGKRVLGDHRSSLTPEMLECTVFLKDLWKVQFKQLLLPIDPLNDCITPEEEVGDWQGSQPPPTA